MVLFLTYFNLFCVVPSWAGIRIDKPKIRLTIASGSYGSGEINVENNGKEPMVVRVYLEDWVYSQEDGAKEFMPKGTTSLSCSNWITFYPADFTLPANGSQIVRYTVNVPVNEKGGHFSVMFFETGGGEIEQVNEQGAKAVVKVFNRLGALFYVEPEGTIQKSAETKNLAITTQLNNLIVSADLLNTGNTNITAKGTFDVLDSQGFVFGRGAFNEVYTLPKDKVGLTAVAKSVNLKPGDYDLIVTLEFENGGTLVEEAGFNVDSGGSITILHIKG